MYTLVLASGEYIIYHWLKSPEARSRVYIYLSNLPSMQGAVLSGPGDGI